MPRPEGPDERSRWGPCNTRERLYRSCRGNVAVLAGLGHRGVILPERFLRARLSGCDDFGVDARLWIGSEKSRQPVGFLLLLLRRYAGPRGCVDRLMGRKEAPVLGRAFSGRRHF